MAENVLETRIQLRYGTYVQWMNSEVILLPGEAAVCIFPRSKVVDNVTDDEPENTPPAFGIKVGDGTRYFYELPWVQAIAADVYTWAKSATKPSYTANEIIGLADYIDQHGGGSGGGSSASSGYRIIYDDATSKYILQIYNEDTGEWVNTTSEINMASILDRLNTIERWANGARTKLGNIELPMSEYIYEEVLTYINQLDYNDQAEPHQFVTSVVEVDGKIQVSRSIISAADITSGTLDTEHGGTGLSLVQDDEVLIGSEQGTITTKKFVTILDPTMRNTFATSGAIIDYITTATAGLTGAMHFVGESNALITNGSRVDPQVNGYDFRNVQMGDVILANNAQEYVWTGEAWRLLGDEGSYAIKGSITNADIAENAAIAQSKIDGLDLTLEGKVSKVEGKDLSTNDFTDEDKQKLDDIEVGAQVNTIEHIFLNDSEVTPTTVQGASRSVNLHINTLTDEQIEKLNGIEEGAEVNSIERVTLDGVEQTIDNTRTLVLNSNPHTEHENVIESIAVNGLVQTPDDNKRVNITIDQAALNLNVLEGAIVPDGRGGTMNVPQVQKKLDLARVAMTGMIHDLVQADNTYITINCGSSTDVV